MSVRALEFRPQDDARKNGERERVGVSLSLSLSEVFCSVGSFFLAFLFPVSSFAYFAAAERRKRKKRVRRKGGERSSFIFVGRQKKGGRKKKFRNDGERTRYRVSLNCFLFVFFNFRGHSTCPYNK